MSLNDILPNLTIDNIYNTDNNFTDNNSSDNNYSENNFTQCITENFINNNKPSATIPAMLIIFLREDICSKLRNYFSIYYSESTSQPQRIILYDIIQHTFSTLRSMDNILLEYFNEQELLQKKIQQLEQITT